MHNVGGSYHLLVFRLLYMHTKGLTATHTSATPVLTGVPTCEEVARAGPQFGTVY
jgi:hypothetical protein